MDHSNELSNTIDSMRKRWNIGAAALAGGMLAELGVAAYALTATLSDRYDFDVTGVAIATAGYFAGAVAVGKGLGANDHFDRQLEQLSIDEHAV